MRKIGSLFLCFFVVSFLAPVYCARAQEADQASSKLVKAVEVEGNKAISTETILARVKTRAGQPYYAQVGRDDIKRLYETGYFSDIGIDVKEEADGIKVIFKVEERPTVKEVVIKGVKLLSRRALKRKMRTQEGQYLNLAYLKEDLAAIAKEYETKGLTGTEIAHTVDIDPATNKAVVTIQATEGRNQAIRRIYIDGNLSFPDGRIGSLIKTHPKAWYLLRPGIFKEQQFSEDLERIHAFYQQNGFLDAQVDYRMDVDARHRIYLRIRIDEGKRYTVGRIVIQGTEAFGADEVHAQLKACLENATFTYQALAEDVANIKSFYFGHGYIFVQVREATALDAASGKVDITYKMVENQVAYVERIDIRGNLKTRDKVIRRELRILPGERFDGDKLKRSKERLYNTGFFEEVGYDTEEGSAPDRQNLIVDVKEAKTGSFSFGGGYSSIDQFVGFIEVQQKNFDWRNWKTFTGGGQDLKLRGEWGSVRQTYELSFTEPWWFDRPLSFGFDAYKRKHDREADVGYGYVEERTGGDLRLSKEFSEYLRGGITYRIEQVKISDVSASASADLRDEEGENWLSSMEFVLTRDTTDNVFNPTRGYVLSGSTEVAGGFLGGTKDFNKFFVLGTQYFPVFGKSVLLFQVRAGVVTPYGDQEKVPIYERFYAGGANTIRGYEERSVGPVDPVTADPLGGEALFVANIEYTVPLLDFLKGAAFVDTGNVWSQASDFGNGGFKTGVGLGVRVKTPIGPLKLDYGIPLDKQPGKQSREGRFHFSMSHGF
ncbi:MAG: outer membrane protein assembly factor BamA [Deltaproteobacteria bacterium]